MRTFRESCELLVASPAYLERAGRPARPEDLRERDTLGFAPEADRQEWEMTHTAGEVSRVEVIPRLVCHDFVMLRSAVLAGLGLALLPESVVRVDIEAHRLERVLPEWNIPLGIVHVVFPSRRGMRPAVRALIDFLAEKLPALI